MFQKRSFAKSGFYLNSPLPSLTISLSFPSVPLLHLKAVVNAETVGAEVQETVWWGGDPILALGSGPAAPGRRFGLSVHRVVCLSAARQSLQGRLGLLPEIAFWCLPGS